jgi:hypothetical protein
MVGSSLQDSEGLVRLKFNLEELKQVIEHRKTVMLKRPKTEE